MRLKANSAPGLLMFLIISLLLVCSYQRNRVWLNEILLWEDAVKKSPLKTRPHFNLGLAKARPHFNLGLAYLNNGRYELAELSFKRVLFLYPDYHKAKYYLAETLFRLGKYEESLKYLLEVKWLYENILPYFPEKWEGVSKAFSGADLYNNIGSCYYFLKKYKEAERYYRKALELEPAHKNAIMGLITVLEETRKTGDSP